MIAFIALSIAFYAAISYGRRQGRREEQRRQADAICAQQAASTYEGANIVKIGALRK